MAGVKLSHELLAHLSIGSHMHATNPALRKIPKEMLDMPFLDMMGMVPKPYHRAIMAKLLEGLVEEPVSQYTRSRLDNLVFFANRAGKEDVDLLNKNVERILCLVEKIWDHEAKKQMAGEVAGFLINYYSGIDDEVRKQVAPGVRKMLLEISPLTRERLIDLLGNSICDFSSHEFSKPPAPDLLHPGKDELLGIFRQEPERVNKTLKCLVDDALREPFVARNVTEVVALLGEALQAATPAVGARIAREYVYIYCAIEDPDLKEEIGKAMGRSLEGYGGILKKLLPLLRNNNHFDAMLAFGARHIGQEELLEILRTRVGEHIAVYESDADAESAESHLGRVVELVHFGGADLIAHAASKVEPGGKAAMGLSRILSRSGCDETSEDRRDLVIFDIIFGKDELLHIEENAESEYVKKIAAARLAQAERKEEETEEERMKAEFVELMRDHAGSLRADAAISRITFISMSHRESRTGIGKALSYLEPAFHAASAAGREKIIFAIAEIHRNLQDKQSQKEFRDTVGHILEEEKASIKRMIINSVDDERKQKKLTPLIMEKLSRSDLRDILFEANRYRIERLSQEFMADPEGSGVEANMARIADIASSDNLGNEVLIHTLGLLLENARAIERRGQGNLAFERIANCIIDISSRLKEEEREGVFLFTTRWLPLLSPKLRTRMLTILELSRAPGQTGVGSDSMIFDIVQPHRDELRHLARHARSAYIREIAKGKIDVEEALAEHPESKIDALREAVKDFNSLNEVKEHGGFTIGAILYLASKVRTTPRQDKKMPRNAVDKTALKAEVLFHELDEVDRRSVKEEIVAECLSGFKEDPSRIEGAKLYLENLVSFSGEWRLLDLPVAIKIINGILDPIDGIPDEGKREKVAKIAAKALIRIAENTKKEIRDELTAHMAKRLKERSRSVRKALFSRIINDKFDDKDEKLLEMLFQLVVPSATDLEFIIKDAKSNDARHMAKMTRAEMRRGGPAEQLDEDERFIVEQIVQFASAPEKALIEGLVKMDPAFRYIRMRMAISALMYEPDGKTVARDWKKRIMAAEKAAQGLYKKLGLEEPDAFTKRDMVVGNPHILTNFQRGMLCGLSGMRPGPDGVDPSIVKKASQQIEKADKKSLRDWLMKTNDLTKLACLMQSNTVSPASIAKLGQGEIDTISWALGKLPSDMTDDDVIGLLNGLANKEKTAFDLLGRSDIDASIENIRAFAARMREASDLFDFFGKSLLPARMKPNKEGVMSRKDGKNDSGFSWILEAKDGDITRIDAVFELMRGDAKAQEAQEIVKEVFELGLMCGMLEDAQHAAILCRIADLIMGIMNNKDVSSGNLKDIIAGSWASLTLAIQEGESLETVNVSKGRWGIFRNGALVKGSENGLSSGNHAAAIGEDPGMVAWTKGKIKSIFRKADTRPGVENTESVSIGYEPKIGEKNPAHTGIGKVVELNVGESKLKPGDVIVLYSNGMGQDACQEVLNYALCKEGADDTGQEISRITQTGIFTEAGSGVDDFRENSPAIAYRYGERK